MEVILTKDVDALGGKNEVVRVKDGFARNYLFPMKAAIPANAGNLKALQSKIKLANEAKTKRVDAAKEISEKLNKLHIHLEKKAGKEGKLFGAVTSQEVADKIKEHTGLDFDKKRLVMAALKTVGVHAVTVRLEVGVSATLHVDIKSDEPLEQQGAAEGEAEQMPEGEGKPSGKAKKAAAAAEAQDATEASEPSAKADREPPKGKKAKGTSEADEDLAPDDAKPKKEKKEKKKRVNEAEMELPD
jgi:large subunit ribosomal protein L9